MPSPAVLERLHAIEARQRTCFQQAANADATLLALTQEGEEPNVAEEARSWARELLTMHDALAEVLRGGDDWSAGLERHAAKRRG